MCPPPPLFSNLVLRCLLTFGRCSQNLACFCFRHLSSAFFIFHIFPSLHYLHRKTWLLPPSRQLQPPSHPGLHFPSESLGPDFLSHLFLLGLYWKKCISGQKECCISRTTLDTSVFGSNLHQAWIHGIHRDPQFGLSLWLPSFIPFTWFHSYKAHSSFHWFFNFFSLFFFLLNTRNSAQALVRAWQALYNWATSPVPGFLFAFSTLLPVYLS